MRILITNDDGIHAEGLKVLAAIAGEMSDDVWVVAPETDQSGMAHSLTLSNPLRLHQINAKTYSVRGTPTDCIMMAVKHIMPQMPDLVLSGVNLGGNLANDVTYSGTIAGAMEGTLQGIRSVALSLEFEVKDGRKSIHWDSVRQHAVKILQTLFALKNEPGILYNVNFPPCAATSVKGVKITSLGTLSHVVSVDERNDGRGNPYFWMQFQRGMQKAGQDSDVRAVRENYISLTPLHLDLTAYSVKTQLSEVFSEMGF